MAGNLNKVMLIGRLGKDPEVRYTKDGTAVCNLSVATSEQWKDKNSGEKQERTEWHRVVLWGRQAEIAQQYLQKGRLVYVEGRLETRKWQDQNGVDKYSTEIKANEFQMLDRGEGAGSGGGGGDRPERASSERGGGERPSRGGPAGGGSRPSGPPPDDGPPPDEDDIPF